MSRTLVFFISTPFHVFFYVQDAAFFMISNRTLPCSCRCKVTPMRLGCLHPCLTRSGRIRLGLNPWHRLLVRPPRYSVTGRYRSPLCCSNLEVCSNGKRVLFSCKDGGTYSSLCSHHGGHPRHDDGYCAVGQLPVLARLSALVRFNHCTLAELCEALF